MLAAVQLGFASLSIVGKVTVARVPPLALVMTRVLGASVVFSLLAIARGASIFPPRKHMRDVLLLALLGVAANQWMFTLGLKLSSAITATALVATIPIFTTGLAIALGRERSSWRVWLGVAIAFAGTLAVLGPSRLALGGAFLLGNALVVANCFVYAIYLVRVRDLVTREDPADVIRWVFLFGAALTVPVGLPSFVQSAPHWDARVWCSILYIVLVPTAFTYGANAWALRRAPSSLVSLFVNVQPVLAVLLTLALGDPLARWLHVPAPHEAFTAWMAVGIVAVLLGVWIATHVRAEPLRSGRPGNV